MSAQRDPRRLSAGADPDFHELVASFEPARTRGPGTEQFARMAAGLAEQIASHRTETSGAAETSRRRWLLKLIGAGMLTSTLILGVALTARKQSSAPQLVAKPHAQPPAAGIRPASATIAAQRSGLSPAVRAPTAKANQRRVLPVRRGRSLPREQSSAHPDVAAELALLQRARANVRYAPELALELAREHAARFHDGVLGEEREVIAIEALLVLHRRQEAEQRAQAFRQQFPESAHARRVRTLFARARAETVVIAPAGSHSAP